jgi:hypothetical protein
MTLLEFIFQDLIHFFGTVFLISIIFNFLIDMNKKNKRRR